MEEIRYLDLYFLFNFAADALALYLCCRILPHAIRFWRLALSALSGALCACVLWILSPGFLINCAAFCLSLPLSLRVALGRTDRRTFWRASLFYPATLCLIGGVLSAFGALISVSGAAPSFLAFLALILFAFLLLIRYCRAVSRATNARVCSVAITLSGKTYVCACLCDSANFLRHEESGLSVILAGAHFSARALAPSELAQFAFAGQEKPPDGKSKLYPIPYRSASGAGLLYGIRVEAIALCRGTKKLPLPDAILAPDFRIPDFSGCDLLLPAGYPERVTERKKAC